MVESREAERPPEVDLFSHSGNFDRSEVFSLAKSDLNFLAGLAMPTIFTEFFPAIHIALFNLLCEKVKDTKGFFRLLLGLPRGHAKTTLIKLFCLYCVLFTDRQFILVICASAPKAESFLSDVWGFLAEPNIISVFGNAALTAKMDNKTVKNFTFQGRNVILAAVGQGSVRGLNIENKRPDVVVFDDAQDKENAESELDSHKLLNWFQSTAMKLRDPRRCLFIWIGNKYRVPDNCVCILEKLQSNPLWTSIVTGAILADGSPLWPELHSLDSLLEEFENDFNMGTPEVFLAEIMNDTDASFNALLDTSKIPRSPYSADKILCQGRYLIIDVASNRIGGDDTAMALFGIYPHEVKKEISTMEGLQWGSLSPKQTIQDALKICFSTGANLIAVEANAYQSTLLFWFGEVCRELEIEGIHLVPVIASGKKTKRILTFLKQLLSGDVYLDDPVREPVFSEALSFKPAKTNNKDNKLDAGAHWQQTIEKYRHLIQLPTAMEADNWKQLGVVEDNTPF
jgi:hypothetical protein